MSNSPMTDEETTWSEEDVAAAVWFRLSATQEEWDEDPISWDLSLEEAARRVQEQDFSPPS